MTQEKVFEAIKSERYYQDQIWNCNTTSSCGNHSPEEWYMYIEDYVNEAKHILSRKSLDIAYPQAMDIMRKISAMTVLAMQQNGTTFRKPLTEEQIQERLKQ